MEVLATRGFKNTFPLPAVDSLGSFKTQVCPGSQSSTPEPFSWNDTQMLLSS